MNNIGPYLRTILRNTFGYLGCLRGCGLLVLLVALQPARLLAQTAADEQPQDKPLRFDVTPLIGYRTSMTFPTEQNGEVPAPNVVLEAKPSYGISAGVRLDEANLIEIRWARQDTNVRLEGGAFPSEKVTLNQVLADFTHEYILDNWGPKARPFVMGSMGATRIAGGTSNNSFTRFTFGLGGGVKFYFTRHLGLWIQGEWLPIVVSPGVGSFVCGGGGCVVQLSTTAVSQGEIVVGPMFRF